MRSREPLRRDQRGGSLVEYVVLVAMAAIAVIAGARVFGHRVEAKVEAQAQCVARLGCSGREGIDASPRARIASAPAAAVAASAPGSPAPPAAAQPGSPAPAPPAAAVATALHVPMSTVATMDGRTEVIGPSHPPSTTAPRGAVADFFRGAILGDFVDDAGWSGVGGQVVVGLIPIAGQVADARDTAAALKSVAQREPGSGLRLVGSLVAWIPGFGDLAKGLFKGGRQIAKHGVAEAVEVVEEGAARAAKQAAEEAATNAVRRITHEEAEAVAEKVLSQSSGLQALSRLMRDPDVSQEQIEAVVATLQAGAQKKYGLTIRFVPNDVDVPNLSRWQSGVAGNYGTWDEAAGTITFRKELWNDDKQLLQELAHEYGAFMLAREFGGKAAIPKVGFARPDGTIGGGVYFTTHVLDSLVATGRTR